MSHSVSEKPSPYFFLSYVHDSGEDDASVKELYERLTHDVRLISGERTADVGFCDVTLRVGDRWSAALVENLSTAQVFVPILSAAYFASAACGKEWAVFTGRWDGTIPAARSTLVPIFWIPMTPEELPPTVLPYQFRDRVFGDVYAQKGLRALIQRKAHADDYHGFVEALAKRIVHLYRTVRVAEAHDRPAFDEVTSAFQPAAVPRQRGNSGPVDTEPKVNSIRRKPQTGMPRLNPADPWPEDRRR